ncbi:riboflavin synthase subunit beta [Nonlabens arenilitoris]|uniref:Riboflavin synthase subunit beta n=1 Tax=Nonlabens arenilitoris TaxID=1217969 RepID=A0A2S7U610_9FLAO|nr:riboflavin synthase subunit beta [Nonlabens arenilitoris]PQJ30449.1 riboflavin synthase subunit beta [Nonlabens arenilitoris]
MGILTRRKNKKYSYEPRFYKQEEGTRPFEIKHKFDEHRSTIDAGGLKNRFNTAMSDYKQGVDASVKRRLYIIIAVLVLVFLWLIDFDLSIFKF